MLAKNDCKSGAMNDTTHITVTTSDNQNVTIDMPMQEAKRVTVREKTTVVEDRDFVHGAGPVATPAVAPAPTGSISTGAMPGPDVKKVEVEDSDDSSDSDSDSDDDLDE